LHEKGRETVGLLGGQIGEEGGLPESRRHVGRVVIAQHPAKRDKNIRRLAPIRRADHRSHPFVLHRGRHIATAFARKRCIIRRDTRSAPMNGVARFSNAVHGASPFRQ